MIPNISEIDVNANVLNDAGQNVIAPIFHYFGLFHVRTRVMLMVAGMKVGNMSNNTISINDMQHISILTNRMWKFPFFRPTLKLPKCSCYEPVELVFRRVVQEGKIVP